MATRTESMYEPVEYVAATTDWLEVTKVVEAGTSTDPDGSTLPGIVLDEQGDQRKVRIHTSYWPGINWAVANGGEVWFALAGPDYPADMVDYVLVVTPSGEVFFPGACLDETVSIPLHERLGPDADALLTALPHVDHANVREHLGLAPLEPDEDQPVILNPQDADPELLARLTPIAVRIQITEQVGDGSLTICSRIEEGWNDCVYADAQAVKGTQVSGYAGDDRVVEFWLLDEIADTAKPLAKLGTATMPPGTDTLDVIIDTSSISDNGEVEPADLVTLRK